MRDWNPEANRLFLKALDLPSPQERRAFLDEACAGNPDLRAQVDALLAAAEQAGSFLDAPAPGLSGTINQSASTPHRGTPAGDDGPPVAPPGYVILGELGRGGMGLVLAAYDATLGREVAIKTLIPGSPARADAAGRFVQEARITARLPHPGVPPVHALGQLPDGSPFLAMKLVRGRTLDRMLRDRSGPADDAPRFVQAFEQVCQAVAFAHEQGVVHRDLKPANVMVGAFGEVQVMDWGLAKVVSGPARGDEAAAVDGAITPNLTGVGGSGTRTGSILGTPAYMAPEQANGRRVGFPADVFALGAILTEILTGRPAHTGPSMLAVLDKAAAGNLSDALGRLAACGADADLTDLARRCLAPDAADRPATAGVVAAAVAAYRAGVEERVRRAETARAEAAVHAAAERKRRQLVTAAAVVVVVVLAAGAGMSAWQAVRAFRAESVAVAQRDAAEKARARALEALDATTSTATGDSLTTQITITPEQRTFLNQVLTYYQDLARETGDDELARKRSAAAAERVARIQARLGRTQEGVAALRLARDGYAALAADFPAVPEYRLGLAVTSTDWGVLQTRLGEWGEAEAAYRAALRLLEALAAEFPAVPEFRRALAGAHTNLGVALDNVTRRSEAETAYRAALPLYERLVADVPAEPRYRSELAAAQGSLAVLLAGLGNAVEAEAVSRAVVGSRQQLVTDFPTVPEYQRALAVAHTNLGIRLVALRRFGDAESAYRTALPLYERLVADFPAEPRFRSELAITRSRLGTLMIRFDRPDEAEAPYRAALAAFEKLVGDFPAMPDYRRELATVHVDLGVLLPRLKRPNDAVTEYRAALPILEKLAADFPGVPQYPRDLAATHANLGALFAQLGKQEEAEAAFRAALALRERLAADFPTALEHQIGLGVGHRDLGAVLQRIGPAEASFASFDKAIAVLGSLVARDPRQVRARDVVRDSHAGRAATLMQMGRYADAVTDWDKAVALDQVGRTDYQVQRAVCLARTDPARAVAEMTRLTTEAKAKGLATAPLQSLQYNAVCVYALASAALAGDERNQTAARAVALLGELRAGGYFTPARVAHLQRDTDLDPLRGRADFQALLAELAGGGR